MNITEPPRSPWTADARGPAHCVPLTACAAAILTMAYMFARDRGRHPARRWTNDADLAELLPTCPGPSRGRATWRAEDRPREVDGVVDAARRLAPPPQSPDGRPSPPRLGPQPSDAHELLRRVSLWPFVRVELRHEGADLHCGGRDTLIARLNLLTGALTAFVAADMGTALLNTQPLLRRTRDGAQIDVIDEDSCKAGERLIRWRTDLERFGAQLREASP
jgi:hypothetical protein